LAPLTKRSCSCGSSRETTTRPAVLPRSASHRLRPPGARDSRGCGLDAWWSTTRMRRSQECSVPAIWQERGCRSGTVVRHAAARSGRSVVEEGAVGGKHTIANTTKQSTHHTPTHDGSSQPLTPGDCRALLTRSRFVSRN